MRLGREARGVFTVAPTPFDAHGSIDWKSLDRLTDFYRESGLDGITVLGQMGEAPRLDADEAMRVVAAVVARAQLPVIVGVSSPGFAGMRTLAQSAMAAGAAGVMIAPPTSLRTDAEIVRYYAGAAEAIGAETPFLIQDYPLIFSVVMSPSVIARIASDNSNCIGLKHEDWPGLQKIDDLRNLETAGEMPRISILCGNGGLFFDFELERRADGAMTGYCFPEMLIDMYNLEDRIAAHNLFDAHLPLIRYEQQRGVGLAVRKYVLMRRGIIESDSQRAPGGSLTDKSREEIEFLLGRLAMSDARAAAIYE